MGEGLTGGNGNVGHTCLCVGLVMWVGESNREVCLMSKWNVGKGGWCLMREGHRKGVATKSEVCWRGEVRGEYARHSGLGVLENTMCVI